MTSVAEDHVERLLDQARGATYPASDPIAVSSAAAASIEAAGIEPAPAKAMGSVPSA